MGLEEQVPLVEPILFHEKNRCSRIWTMEEIRLVALALIGYIAFWMLFGNP